MPNDNPTPTQRAMAAARAEQDERFLAYAEKQQPVTDDGIAMLALAEQIRALRAELAAAKETITGQVNQIANQSREMEALRAMPAELLDVHAICDQRDKAVHELAQLRAELAAKGEREKTLLTALRNMRDLIHHNVSGKVNLAWAEEIDEADELLRASALSANAANKGEKSRHE